MAEIVFQDSGIGIAHDKLPGLFGIKEKNNTMPGTKGEKGSGLGLMICKEFVELNKGSIAVVSEINKGSKFTVSMPLFDHHTINENAK
jgi:signal transduction histidine kinase